MTMKLMTAADKLTWSHDWSDFLAVGETISTRQWTIDPDASPTHLSNDTTATVTVDNLTWGNTYILSETIVTSAANEAERSLTIVCGQY